MVKLFSLRDRQSPFLPEAPSVALGLAVTAAGAVMQATYTGTSGDDLYTGTTSADTIDGAAGNDTLNGDSGNDLIFGGDGNDSIVAGHGNDTVTGGDGDDSLNGHSGADIIDGGAGNDTILGAGGWAGADTLRGGDGDDELVGGQDGDDFLMGGAGNDSVYGSHGVDTVSFSDADQAMMVNLNLDYAIGQGNDSISSVEDVIGTTYNDTLIGSVLSNGFEGGDGNDSLSGSSGNDTLTGGNGNDDLLGGTGNDKLSGGDGNDILEGGVSDSTETIDGGAGIDIAKYSTASSAVAVDLAILIAQGTGGGGSDIVVAVENVTGSRYGDDLKGNAGGNQLDGGTGNDTMTGRLGDDTYVVNVANDVIVELAGEGNDLIRSSASYTLGANLERLELTTGNTTATGNGLNNSLTGSIGNNNLDGQAGADTMTGGLGNDTYYVDDVSDSIVELASGGTDFVYSSVSYNLAGKVVENLTMTGSANLVAYGNGVGNKLTGNSGNNALTGAGGNDTLTGGLGDDTYWVQDAGDKVAEANGEGSDIIYASVTYNLTGRYVEVLQLSDGGNYDATGNSLGNTLRGNNGNNTLNGLGGNDILTGGMGTDIFLFQTGSRLDTITDFTVADGDLINVNAYTGGVANAGMVSQAGANVVVNLGSGNIITVLDAARADVLSHIVW